MVIHNSVHSSDTSNDPRMKADTLMDHLIIRVCCIPKNSISVIVLRIILCGWFEVAPEVVTLTVQVKLDWQVTVQVTRIVHKLLLKKCHLNILRNLVIEFGSVCFS